MAEATSLDQEEAKTSPQERLCCNGTSFSVRLGVLQKGLQIGKHRVPKVGHGLRKMTNFCSLLHLQNRNGNESSMTSV